MKRITYLIGICSLIIAVDGCKALGIGKECYACTTSSSRVSTKVEKEICGSDEMHQYMKDNNSSTGAGIISTVCKQKN